MSGKRVSNQSLKTALMPVKRNNKTSRELMFKRPGARLQPIVKPAFCTSSAMLLCNHAVVTIASPRNILRLKDRSAGECSTAGYRHT